MFTFYFLNDKILTYVNLASFFLGTIMRLIWGIGELPSTPPVLTWRDHPFQMSAFFRGGVKNSPNLETDSSKILPTGRE